MYSMNMIVMVCVRACVFVFARQAYKSVSVMATAADHAEVQLVELIRLLTGSCLKRTSKKYNFHHCSFISLCLYYHRF